MSKIDELAEVFRAGLFGHLGQNPYATVTEGDRAGIIAVVKALRDDATSRANAMLWDGQDFEDFFDQILGSDAGEKVAGSTPEGAVLSSSAEGEPPASPATTPAPAVCVWTQQSLQAFYNSECGLDSMTHGNAIVRCQGHCPSCGKPIRFAEAK